MRQSGSDTRSSIALYGLGLSALLFVAGLALPAYTVQGAGGPEVVPAFLELAIGGLGLAYGYYEWLANPLLFVTWFLMLTRRYKRAAVAGVAAALISAGFLIRHDMLISEAPTYGRVLGYHAGYWLWVASCTVAGLSSAGAKRATALPRS